MAMDDNMKSTPQTKKNISQEESCEKNIPSAFWSLLPVVLLVVMLFLTIHTFGRDALAGASQVTLLTVSAFCVLIGTFLLHVPFKKFEEAITQNISTVSSALIILMLIGALSGAWMVSGVVPALIYYGVQIIHPEVFLASACIISALVSVMTGSSWTTIATIGIAFMGIGRAQGFDEGWIAGAIISGAYFGDKISPLSDTTVLASGAAGVPLFTHIRYMLLTTIPSLTIAVIIFAVASFLHTANDSHQIATFSVAISEKFNISIWLLAVPLLTAVMIARRLPSLVTLFLSTLLGIIFALIFQPHILSEIADGDIFKGAIRSVYGATAVSTDNAMLAELTSTRGMAGMLDTIWLIICAMCFGGTMSAGGMVKGITRIFVRMIKGRTTLVGSTAGSGLMLNVAIADQYISILLIANMFKDIFDNRGYERRLLSRTVEDSVTVTSVLVPWNTCGMTQSTVLGVSTFTYLPYCFFNILSPITSVIVAAIGYKIVKPGERAKA